MTNLLVQYVKDRRKIILIIISILIINFLILNLSRIDIEVILYPVIVSCFILTIIFLLDFYSFYKKAVVIKSNDLEKNYLDIKMPSSNSYFETEYQNIIQILINKAKATQAEKDIMENEIKDYYTMWVHQIKTPLSAMSLIIQTSDETELSKKIQKEIFFMEHYLEMLLNFVKLESLSSDLVLKKVDLEKIIKLVIKKYSEIFIAKKIKLELDIFKSNVVTDEKWIGFVIEQIISNSLKYTKESGTIAIKLDEKNLLSIIDNGIGIATEDLPRIFEKGFTGYNGRKNQKSSGMGLYICGEILKKLSHKFYLESEVGSGTLFKIEFQENLFYIE